MLLVIFRGQQRATVAARGQMNYDMLLATVKGLETFFSEVQGSYWLTFFYVLKRASLAESERYGQGVVRWLVPVQVPLPVNVI